MTLYTWSKTAASNNSADGTINWTEGQSPSSVNDSARAVMAAVAKWRDDNAGSLLTGGSSTAYTITSNQVFSSLALMSGQSLRVKFHTTSGASPTLNVDGLGAKALVTVAASAIATGAIVTNSVYDLVYDNTNSCWIVVSLALLTFPSGTRLLFQQQNAPTGWTKETTTYDNHALRINSTGTVASGGSLNFTDVFTSRTILQANLPLVNFTGSNNITVGFGFQPVQDGGANFNMDMGGTGTRTISQTLPSTSSTATANNISVSSGGSGTGFNFTVKYVDFHIAVKV